MKRFLITAGMLVTFLVAGMALAEEKGAATMSFKGGKKGAVAFDHAKHQGYEGVTCDKCHHTDKGGKAATKCSECHAKPDAKVNGKKAFHKTCKDCHKSGKKGPTKCKECHKK